MRTESFLRRLLSALADTPERHQSEAGKCTTAEQTSQTSSQSSTFHSLLYALADETKVNPPKYNAPSEPSGRGHVDRPTLSRQSSANYLNGPPFDISTYDTVDFRSSDRTRQAAPGQTRSAVAVAASIAIIVALLGVARIVSGLVTGVDRPQSITSLAPFTFHGQGIAPCRIPSATVMADWLASPYRAIFVFIGPVSGCGGNITASWVHTVENQGWTIFPVYVGPQASCALSSHPNPTINPAHPAAGGARAADHAITQLRKLGLTISVPVIYDMEGYTDGCGGSGVTRFLDAWDKELHKNNYRSGVFEDNFSNINDLVKARSSISEPDIIWFGAYKAYAKRYFRLALDVWNQRYIYTYLDSFPKETYGGVPLTFERNVIDIHLTSGPR
jgi:hypothetical protein